MTEKPTLKNGWLIFATIIAITVLVTDVALWIWGKRLIDDAVNNVRAESEDTIATFYKKVDAGVS